MRVYIYIQNKTMDLTVTTAFIYSRVVDMHIDPSDNPCFDLY